MIDQRDDRWIDIQEIQAISALKSLSNGGRWSALSFPLHPLFSTPTRGIDHDETEAEPAEPPRKAAAPAAPAAQEVGAFCVLLEGFLGHVFNIFFVIHDHSDNQKRTYVALLLPYSCLCAPTFVCNCTCVCLPACAVLFADGIGCHYFTDIKKGSKEKKKRIVKRGLCSSSACSTLVYARGLCVKHGGKRTSTCTMPGCTTNAQARGLCTKHGAKGFCSILHCTYNADTR